MSAKAMAAIVAAVAVTVVAAMDVRPSTAMRNPWLRQAVPVNDSLPPGHPAVPGRQLPPGHPPIEGYLDLPEGHPPIPWQHPGSGCPEDSLRNDGVIDGRGALAEPPDVIST